MFIAIAICILGCAIFTGMAVDQMISRRAAVEHTNAIVDGEDVPDLHTMELAKPFSQRIMNPIMGRIVGWVMTITPTGILERLESKIMKSGLIVKPINIVVWQIILCIAIPGTLALLGIATKVSMMQAVVVFAIMAVIGYSIPYLWIMSLINKRNTDITYALPNSLDIISVSVEAGLGFDMALQKVVEKTTGPLADEFATALHEIRLGKSRKQALRNLTGRMDVTDMNQFVASLIQADKLGIELSKMLKIQADQMRLKKRQRAEEAARKAPIKMSIVLVFFILPALIIVIMGPAILSIIQTLGVSNG